MFEIANWVAHLNGYDGPGGSPSHETFLVSPQGELEISSFAGHPRSMFRDNTGSPGLVAKFQCLLTPQTQVGELT